jgi:putative ABC transport system permease protein
MYAPNAIRFGGAHPGSGPSVKISVAGQPNLPLSVDAYDGDSYSLGWNLISGRWYSGAGQAVANSSFLAATGRAVGDRVTLDVSGKPVSVLITGEIFTPVPMSVLYTGLETLSSAAAGLPVDTYDLALEPGTSVQAYTNALSRTLGPYYIVAPPSGPSVAAEVDLPLFRLLAVLVAVLAGLGVLNSVLMATRERVHDLGVFKAVGMTPRQTIAMVVCWVVVPTIIAAAVALPAGLTLQAYLVRRLAATGTGITGLALPGSFVHVLGVADLALLVLAGLGIAILGSLGPAAWAAVARTTTALRAE